MVHDLVLALVFLAMIIAPALLAMRSEKEENDTLWFLTSAAGPGVDQPGSRKEKHS